MPIVVSESGSFVSTKIGLILNPTSDGFPAQLDIANGAYGPKEAAFPPPSPKPAYASSYDTEGSVATDPAHYENREITISMWVVGSGSASAETALNALYKMVGQINREGGVLKFTSPAQTVCYFDLVPEANANLTVDYLYLWKNRAEVTLTLQARPFWRGDEVDLGTTSETTLPWLILTEAGQAGDVPSLGRLVVTEADADTQWTVIVGGQSRYYDTASTAALAYQAEDLAPGVAGAAGASGNVYRNTDLTTNYQALLKSDLYPSGTALTHKGTFRVWGRFYRPTSNTGAVSVRLEWGEGDYLRPTLNDPVDYAADDREGVFTWANLGLVHISPDSTQWEFRPLAKSTVAGDEIDLDCILLFPTEVVYTELSGKARFETASIISARDEFDQTAGSLAGKTAPVGGVWAEAGDAVRFTLDTGGHTAQRTEVSDADITTGAYAVSGVAASTAQAVQIDFKAGTSPGADADKLAQGALARYTDTSNWLMATAVPASSTTGRLQLRKRVAGAVVTLKQVTLPSLTASTWYTVRVQVDAAGRYWVWFFPTASYPGEPLIVGQHADLATGGALASGKPGFYDAWTEPSAYTRNYDNFFAFAPTPDAALFASQSLTLSHDGATREDSTGSLSTTISDRRGRYLKIPPAGPENRSTRLVVKGFGNDPYTMADVGIHDISAQLFVTPRGLVVPEA